jgi:hypothetical protein
MRLALLICAVLAALSPASAGAAERVWRIGVLAPVGDSSVRSVNEDLVQLLRGQPYTGIADGDHKLLVFRSPRLDGKLARSLHILHRINAVTD